MLVVSKNLTEVVSELSKQRVLSLDTETTGLQPFHGDRIFSLIIAYEDRAFYFNFQAYPDVEEVLNPDATLKALSGLFQNPDMLWYMHNAKFDMHMLAQHGVKIAGDVHCTQVVARIENNIHKKYSLDACAQRIGLKKDDAVEDWIKKNGAWEWVTVPGKKKRDKNKFFWKVPFGIIHPYGEQDALVTYKLGEYQREKIERMSNSDKIYSPTCPLPRLREVVEIEKKLVKTIVNMEQKGAYIDVLYCKNAIKYEENNLAQAEKKFAELTGVPFKDSNKVFAKVFEDDKENWGVTKKGGISFDSDSLKSFKHPAAPFVLECRDAKTRINFFAGFLYHMTDEHKIHPNLKQDGTTTGRLSCTSPNLQNLPKRKDKSADVKYKARRAIIPPPGFSLLSIDYDQVEYRLMVHYANDVALLKAINTGLDPHEAVAGQMAIERDPAKTINFMLLYGGGILKLAKGLGCSFEKAQRLRFKYFAVMPRVRNFIRDVISKTERKRYIINWTGRILRFPNKKFAYKGPNALCQSGCADLGKKAMIAVDSLLADKKSYCFLQVHDELVFAIAKGEEYLIPKLVEVMENIFPRTRLTLTAGAAVSDKSWGDMEDVK